MLDKLFNSGTRLKVLNWFLSNPDKEVFIQELLRNIGTDARNVFTELNYLENLGILISRKQGRERFFKVNQQNQYYQSLYDLFSVYKKDLNSNKEVLDLLVDDFSAYPQILFAAADVKKINSVLENYKLKSRISTLLHNYENTHYTVWASKKEFRSLSKEISDKVEHDGNFITKLFSEFEAKKTILTKICSNIETQNLAKLSNLELLDFYTEYYIAFEEFSLLQWLFIEFDENNLVSNLLFENLETILKTKPYYQKNQDSLLLDVTILTTDFNFSKSQEESQSFLKIISYIQTKPKLLDYLATTESRFIFQDLVEFDNQLLKMVQLHTQKFSWLSYGFSGPGWDEQYYLSLISGICRLSKKYQVLDLSTEIKNKLELQKNKIQKNQQNLISKYELNQVEIEFITRIKSIQNLASECLDIFYYVSSTTENLFREIGKRFFLSINQVRYIYPFETAMLFNNPSFDSQILNDRISKSSHLSSTNSTPDNFVVGTESENLIQNFSLVKEEKRAFSLLRGVTTSPGLALGKTFRLVDNLVNKNTKKVVEIDQILVLKNEDFAIQNYPNVTGVILESSNLSVEFIALCRFLGIACVSGVSGCFELLSQNQDVLLDSLHGKVIII